MNKDLKRIIFFGLSCLMGVFLIVVILVGIDYLLAERGVTILHKNLGEVGLSFIWVNWELHIIFASVMAGVTWLIYKLNFVWFQKDKTDENNP